MSNDKQRDPLPAPKQDLSFDEALTHYVGEFGKGQLRIVAAASLLGIPNGLIFLLWVMVTIDPIKNHAWRCTSGNDAACAAVWGAPSSHAFCELPANSWEWTSLDSLVSRFSLICSDSWKVQFANSLMFVGCFIGSGLFGAWSDRIGRKIPLFVASAVAAAATFVSTAAPNYWFVAAMRGVVGIGAAGQVQGVVLLCMETTGRSFRGIAGVPQVVLFGCGEYLLVALAVLAPNWRSLTLAAGCVGALALLLYPVVPESARWLMSQEGKEEKAVELLRNISVSNGSKMPERHMLRSKSSRGLGLHCSSSTGQVLKSSSSVLVDGLAAVPGDQQQQRQLQLQSSKSMPVLRHDSSVHPVDDSSSSASSSNEESWGDAADKTVTNADTMQVPPTVAAAAAAGGSLDDSTAAAAAAAAAAKQRSLGQLLWRHPSLAAMSLVMLLVWFSNFSSFYVIALGSGGLPGSIYVTFSLQVTGQIVATLMSGALIDRLGRHNIISASLLIGGAACLACANTANKTAQIVLATIGQFGCTASLAATPIYTAELYPTPVRSTALGMCNKACRCGSISAPFLLMLGTHTAAAFGSALFMPYVIVGSVCLLAGALVLLMPETLGKDMPECMEDLAQLQTVFSTKPWKQSRSIITCSSSCKGAGSSCCWATLAFLFRTRAEPKSPSAAVAADADPAQGSGVAAQAGTDAAAAADADAAAAARLCVW